MVKKKEIGGMVILETKREMWDLESERGLKTERLDKERKWRSGDRQTQILDLEAEKMGEEGE